MRLRVIDLETSGLDPAAGAEIIEIGWTDVDFTRGQPPIIGSPTARLFGCSAPCPADNIAVHHIKPRQLEGLPAFCGDDLAQLQDGADVLVAHSSAFESVFLPAERPWICTLKAASRLWPEAPAFSNQTLRYWLGYGDLPDELAMPPHRAGPDSYVTAHILVRVLELAGVRDLITWTGEPRVLPRCPIGKDRGKPWAEVDAGFLKWILSKSDMEADTVWNARRELERRSHG